MNGLFYGGDLTLLGHQAMGVLFTLVVSGVVALVVGLAIKYTIGWRIPEEDEVDGIDFAQHGETAYDFVSLSGSSGVPSAVVQASSESRGVNA